MNFKIGEDIVCINDKFKQVYGTLVNFKHPKRNEIVTIKSFKENWIQLEQYSFTDKGVPLYFSRDRFRKLTAEDLELTEQYELTKTI